MGIGIKTISGTNPKKLTAPGSSAEYIQNKNIGNLTVNFMVFVLENQYTWHWGYNLEQFAEVMEYMITSAVRPCQDSSTSSCCKITLSSKTLKTWGKIHDKQAVQPCIVQQMLPNYTFQQNFIDIFDRNEM